MAHRTNTSAVLIVLLSAASCGLAVAEPPEGLPDRGTRPPRTPLFRMLDQDRDGQLTMDEIDAWAAKLKGFDSDDDGVISHEEMRTAAEQVRASFSEGRRRGPGTEGPGQGRGEFRRGGADRGLDRLFERDADGDGKLSGDELPERLKERLSALDANGDEAVDRDELMQGMRHRGQRAGRPPRPPRGPDQRPDRPAAPRFDGGIDV